MKLILLFLLPALAVQAQTNVIKTNALAVHVRKVVTKEMVLAGLKTLDDEIAALNKNRDALEDQILMPGEKAQLQCRAGLIGSAEAMAIGQACQHQWSLLCEQTQQRIAAIKVQQIDIRQRYAAILAAK